MLGDAIGGGHREGKPVHVLGLAAGGGRYVLETLSTMTEIPVSATLRDWSPSNLEAAARLAAELGLRNVAVERGDAFDRESIAAARPRPSVVVVSGLYELFPDNNLLARSLAGIAGALGRGG